MTKTAQQYGTWASPISAKMLANRFTFGDVQWDDDGETLVWLEGRGKQGVLVAQTGAQAPRDLTDELSVRAQVSYGGGEFTVADGHVYFVAASGRLYRQALAEGRARAITPEFGKAAAPTVSPDGRWVVYVHHYEGVDGLALVDTQGGLFPRKLAYGTDFVMQPTWHPSGTRLAYITWDHPLMPWDGTQLKLATLDTDSEGVPRIASVQTIAGDVSTAIFQPEFSPDGRYLSYISDATGWGQLYLYDLAKNTHTQLTDAKAEHGAPAWLQGMRTYSWTRDSRALYVIRSERGFHSLWRVDATSRRARRMDALSAYTHFRQIAVSPVREGVALLASSPVITERIISYEPENDFPARLSADPEETAIAPMILVEAPRGELIHRRSSSESIMAAELSPPQAVEWVGYDSEKVFGLYYPPASERYTSEGAPPLIVYVHGGPTSQASATYSRTAQFFATRGFAVLEVNYRGSTGYGRAYMAKLRGMWGVYDVEDCATGAVYLSTQGLADTDKCVIMGGSAGGYTVLQSLATMPGVYKAGVCLYGISNLFTLALPEWKFEYRYNDSLLGALPGAASAWRGRSPIFHADKIVDPVAIFQGEDDVVVPKAQADSIVAALKSRGVPHEYHVYAGEGHGWRKPETIEAFYNAVMAFLQRYVIYG